MLSGLLVPFFNLTARKGVSRVSDLRILLLILGITATPLVLTGCGSGEAYTGKTVTLSGKVTKGTVPVTDAGILVIAAKSAAAFRSDLTSDGSYQVQLIDVVPGDEFQVAFGPRETTAGEAAVDAAGLPVSTPPQLPKRYLDAATSGLKLAATGESRQTQDFVLEEK